MSNDTKVMRGMRSREISTYNCSKKYYFSQFLISLWCRLASYI